MHSNLTDKLNFFNILVDSDIPLPQYPMACDYGNPAGGGTDLAHRTRFSMLK